MPLRNRVTPLGELIATPARGGVYGNRGCLHDAAGEIRRRWNGRRWIACRLEFKGWHRSPLLQPGRFTELFFLDEVTAFAAGHRPCALCRRADFDRFRAIWSELHPGDRSVDDVDRTLHAERVELATGERRLHRATLASLPDGAFLLSADGPRLLWEGRLWLWAPAGYRAPSTLPHGDVSLLTPPSLASVLASGWSPVVPLVGNRRPTA
ncbi:MAG: hypothetical protein U0R50_13880 [Gaiellales bacterium]